MLTIIFCFLFSYDLEFTVASDLVAVSSGALLHQVNVNNEHIFRQEDFRKYIYSLLSSSSLKDIKRCLSLNLVAENFK